MAMSLSGKKKSSSAGFCRLNTNKETTTFLQRASILVQPIQLGYHYVALIISPIQNQKRQRHSAHWG
ncbi:MAG TPA: hypothetical protein VHX86_04885 [Tepidisphaeraceae bacterium]|nr:hypothetical protein [Tepidisphaeraceae bacterium]